MLKAVDDEQKAPLDSFKLFDGEISDRIDHYLRVMYSDVLRSSKDPMKKRKLTITVTMEELESGKISTQGEVKVKLGDEIQPEKYEVKSFMKIDENQLLLIK